MIKTAISLKFVGPLFLAIAFLLGLTAATLWQTSVHKWETHLSSAADKGETLFDFIKVGAELPEGLSVTPLPKTAQDLATNGRFERLPNLPRPPLVTRLTVHADAPEIISGTSLRLAIVSSALRYPISELTEGQLGSPRRTLGAVTRLVARYCSDAVLFASRADGTWQRFDGQNTWGCDAAPRDRRLLAVAFCLLSLVFLASFAANTANAFSDFSKELKSQRRLGGADAFAARGPSELRDLIEAVNEYRALERKHLEERALVLSGVTHDLGTPATRLRLRAELIQDPELRAKFETDIDRMTGIIESVLTYTRAELSTEEARNLSLISLVDSVVADYADVGHPVVFDGSAKIALEGGRSIFMSRRGQSQMTDDPQIILRARPIALQRALSNLIDNALKYGRRAAVQVETDTKHAHILVQDNGGQNSFSEVEQMTAPFRRGANSAPIQGFGMGLTIASTIALEHGGTLTFEPGDNGLIARLSIAR